MQNSKQLELMNVGYQAPVKRNLCLRDLPAADRPQNRLERLGAGSLSVAELLSIVIGGADALEISFQLLADAKAVSDLARLSTSELLQIDGIGPTTAARIQAAIELGRRLLISGSEERAQVRTPSDAANLIMAEMSLLEQEELRTVLLDTKNYVVSIRRIYVGSLNAAVIRVGEVFKFAVRDNSAGLIVVHNHPSGDPTPSPEDVRVTEMIVEAGRLLDIDVVDHLVVGHNRYVSMKERGLGFR